MEKYFYVASVFLLHFVRVFWNDGNDHVATLRADFFEGGLVSEGHGCRFFEIPQPLPSTTYFFKS